MEDQRGSTCLDVTASDLLSMAHCTSSLESRSLAEMENSFVAATTTYYVKGNCFASRRTLDYLRHIGRRCDIDCSKASGAINLCSVGPADRCINDFTSASKSEKLLAIFVKCGS